MKKLILSFVVFTSLICASFAENFFAHRFFEIKVDVPVEVSNNLLGITDIMKKDVVIDLAEIADNVKDKGAAFKGSVAPSVSIGIDIPRGLILGVKVGAEADVGVGLSKDLFTFLGKGNVAFDDRNRIEVRTSNTYADMFATVSVNGGWNSKKSRLEFTGTAFSALAHFDATDTYASLYINEDTNTIKYDANVGASLYTNINYNSGFDDIQAILNSIKNNMGFDLSANYQRDLFRFLTVGATARIPLAPSKLSMCSAVAYNQSGEISLDQFLGSSEDEGNSGSNSGNVDPVNEPDDEETSDSMDFNGMIGEPVILAEPYAVHRPLKVGVSANFHPFGTLLSTKGYIGIGIRHPFAKAINGSMAADNTDFYVDYSIGGRLSLWNVLSLELTHECMDEVYKNQLALALNIRLVEVDAGVSMASTNFTKSFSGAGLGAFVTVAVGF